MNCRPFEGLIARRFRTKRTFLSQINIKGVKKPTMEAMIREYLLSTGTRKNVQLTDGSSLESTKRAPVTSHVDEHIVL